MIKQRILLFFAAIGIAIAPLMTVAKSSAAETTAPAFGFTVGLNIDPTMTAQQWEDSLTQFKQDVDILAANHQSWVRFGIPAWAVAWHNSDMNLQPSTPSDTDTVQTMSYYERAIDYVKAAGMKLYLILTEVSAQGNEYTQAEYAAHAEDYWHFIADRIATKIDVLQIYNEAQEYHYRFYTDVADDDLPAYWAEMNDMLGRARTIFKAKNPNILMTTNGAGYPVTPEREQDWLAYMDGVQGNLDVIALDLYPEGMHEIPYLATSVQHAEDRYHKPVIIAEIGRHGYADGHEPDPSRTYAAQEENVVEYMDTLRETNVMAAILYELRDSGTDPDEGEEQFGILKNNGDKKPSFDGIMYAMRPAASNDDDTTQPGGDGDNDGNGNSNTSGASSGDDTATSTNATDETETTSATLNAPNTGALQVTQPAIIITTLLASGALITGLTYLVTRMKRQ